MPDSYKYIDPDYIYTDPKTGILRNLAGITDLDSLLFFESGAVTKRIQELYENPIKIKGIESTLISTATLIFTVTTNLRKSSENDNQPIGIILSEVKDDIMIEYATLNDKSKLLVSKYQLYLPDKEEIKC